mgnify:FL=1
METRGKTSELLRESSIESFYSHYLVKVDTQTHHILMTLTDLALVPIHFLTTSLCDQISKPLLIIEWFGQNSEMTSAFIVINKQDAS